MHRCLLEVPPFTSKHGMFYKNLRYCVSVGVSNLHEDLRYELEQMQVVRLNLAVCPLKPCLQLCGRLVTLLFVKKHIAKELVYLIECLQWSIAC